MFSATRSRSRRFADPWQGHVSESQARRELMLPHEIRELDRCKELVLVEAAPPVKAEKIRYYKDHTFAQRLRDSVDRHRLAARLVEPPVMPTVASLLSDADIDDVLAAVKADHSD